MLIDSHAHLFWPSFEIDLDLVVKRAEKNEVKRIIVPGVDEKSSNKAVELAKKYRGVIWAGVGIHPEAILEKEELRIEAIENLIKKNKQEVVAIGEVGLDLHTLELKEKLEQQEKLFGKMVGLAKKYGLPLIIHSRESEREILKVIDKIKWYKGVFHCFSGTKEGLKEILKRGFKVSFCGNITWSKRVAKLLAETPIEKLLIETDSPFMVPRDEKGEPVGKRLRNEPKNVRILAEKYSLITRVERLKLEKILTQNTQDLFGI